MNTSIKHLPAHKQNELKAIVQTIVSEFKNVEMIILFGSYSRGDQVEDKYVKQGAVYEYRSDFDLLIVLTHGGKSNNATFKYKVNEVIRNVGAQTPSRTIIQGISSVNQLIDIGSPLFTDIRTQGIVLYNSGNFNLGNPRKLKPEEVLTNAQSDFTYWYEGANDSYRHYNYAMKDESYKKAAFELHQTTERYYAAILMVFTGYKAKDHDIESLGLLVNELDHRFELVFPMESEEEKYRFYLLKKAYVDSRYEKDYAITKTELEYLSKRITIFKQLTKELCDERLIQLQKAVADHNTGTVK